MAKDTPKILKELKSVIVPEVQYETQKSVSYSQLSMFSNSPYQWGLRYRDGHKAYTPSIHAGFGTALHTTIQHYLTLFYDESVAAADRLDLNSLLKTSLKIEYLASKEKNNNTDFSNPAELNEFYNDGINIIKYIKTKKAKYFSKRGWHLVGVELPLSLQPNKSLNNIMFIGFLDLVLYHEDTNIIKIIDIKTSTRG